MSWSWNAKISDGEISNEQWSGNDEPETMKQFEMTLAAVNDIISSGAVGEMYGSYRVSISGHANEGHKPKAGWSNDSVSINIYQENS